MKRTWLFSFLLLAAILLWSKPAQAYLDISGIRQADQLGQTPCENGNNCPGWCQCSFEFEKPKDIESVGRRFYQAQFSRQWNFFNPLFEPLVLIDDDGWNVGWHTYAYQAVLRWELKKGKPSCSISYEENIGNRDSQYDARNFIKQNTCAVKPAYCCCAVDANNQQSDCVRSADYNIINGEARCPSGKRYAGAEIGEGCLAQVNKQSTRPGEEPTEPLEVAVGRLQRQTAALNRIGRFTSPAQVLGFATSVLVAFIGALALVMYIFAGFLWMTAAGNTERIEHAKRLLVWTTVAVAIMISSYLLVSRVFVFLAK